MQSRHWSESPVSFHHFSSPLLISDILIEEKFLICYWFVINEHCNFLLFFILSSAGERALGTGIIEPCENGSKLYWTSTDCRRNDFISIPPSDVEIVSRKLCSIADYFPFRKSINLIEKLHYICPSRRKIFCSMHVGGKNKYWYKNICAKHENNLHSFNAIATASRFLPHSRTVTRSNMASQAFHLEAENRFSPAKFSNNNY